MTGAEHYRAGERALIAADKMKWGDPEIAPVVALAVALAQVHFTAALAAATALGGDLMQLTEVGQWQAAIHQTAPAQEAR